MGNTKAKNKVMGSENLNIYKKPRFDNPRLLLGFSDWMDGGEVSTGAVKCIIEKLDAQTFAEIEPKGFYIYNFPGSMELSTLFRPHTQIKDGLIRNCEFPTTAFFYSEQSNLILLLGREPNLNWEEFADCIFSLCTEFGVKMIYFIGSVSGLVPHTRDPRFFCSVSNAKLKKTFEHYGIKFTDYKGPASVATYLASRADKEGLGMVSFVATVPAYVQGRNPKCIEAVTRRLAGILELEIELDDLSNQSDEYEKRLNEVVQEQPELAGNIKKLEEDYDNEIFDSELGELKNWLQQQGIRLD